MKRPLYLNLILIVVFLSCQGNKDCVSKTLKVTATAYNSVAYQTNSNPHITAFGDSLKPGLKYIAVSRDLLNLGLVHNTEIKIAGLDGVFLVKDKMNRRYRKHIDIYMGTDVNKAKEWGRKKVTIEYCEKTKDTTR